MVDDPDELFLKEIEYGASPYFLLTARDSSLTKETKFDYLIRTKYSMYKQDVFDQHIIFKGIFDSLVNSYIVGHQEVMDDLFETTYDNGTKIYVNYNNDEIEYLGNIIDARSYLVLEGGSSK